MPPSPVFDSAVPHWHLAAWVRGDQAKIGEQVVGLTSQVDHYVEAAYFNHELKIKVDGELKAQISLTVAKPEITAEVVHTTALTSWFDDETKHTLLAGESYQWEWGSNQPVEISLAVRGTAEVQVQGMTATTIPVCSPDTYSHVHLITPVGAERLVVKAAAGGAEVTDVTMTSRQL